MVWGGGAGRFSTTTVSALGPAAQVRVSSSIQTDLVLDVIGYYRVARHGQERKTSTVSPRLTMVWK